MSAEEAGFLRDLYDGEIRYTDRGIGRLLDRLDQLDLRDDTIVVLTADHGEEFLDHGGLGHTSSLYEELVRVPLIVRNPRRDAESPAVVTRPVSLVSLMPTVLDLVGSRYRAERFHGPSLAPLLTGEDPDEEPLLLAEVDFVPVRKGRLVGEVHKKAVIGERFKLVRDDPTGKLELFDLAADPREAVNLADRDPLKLSELSEALERLLEEVRADALEPQPRKLDDSEIERLIGLGYVGD
jgi:arylsulfatase A-like enzyme